jgi:ABC-type hemin transport system substrate-binding protein
MKNPSAARRPFNIQHSTFNIPVLLVLLLACAPQHTPTDRPPARVVSIAPNVTEMIFALGSGSAVVGTDDYSDYPAAAKALPKVGGVQPNVERIAALRPDVVIANAAGMNPALHRALDAVHVPVVVVRNERISDVFASMARIGALLHSPRRGEAVAAMRRAMESQRRTRGAPPRVMLAVWTDPLYVAGRETFADDLFALCGARNAVEVRGWPQYSLETFAAHPPDLLLYPNRSVTPQAAAALIARSGAKIEAVPVDENVFTRPGPRIAEAAAALNAILDRWKR